MLALAGVLACAPVGAFESDVHFGLTRWLALKAGFDERQATAIALGDQRIDSGMMETLALVPEFACTSSSAEVARDVQHAHFPASRAVPAPLTDRVVQAAAPAARADLDALQPRLAGKEHLMLGKLGEALHPLQDAWAHQGMTGAATPGLACDPALLPPGGGSHDPELTRSAPAAVLSMARSTYEALRAYPPVQGRSRSPAAWDTLAPRVSAFARLATKTEKRAWFLREGIADTSFLEGVTLPDGPSPGPLAWDGRKLPALANTASIQHDAPKEARAFVDGLLANWLGTRGVGEVVAAAVPQDMPARNRAELTARMKLWKWQDHGSAAPLLHAARPLTAAQLHAADRLTHHDRGYVHPSAIAQAVFPLQPLKPAPAPLVPYILRDLAPVQGGASAARMVALLRLRHAPYDTVGWVIEQREQGWRLVDVLAVVDR